MENKYLNEEKYQETKKKLITLSIIIFVVGLILGLSLIIIGAVKSSNYKNSISKVTTKDVSSIKERISELKEKIKGIDVFSDEYEELEDELSDLQDELELNNAKEFFDEFGFTDVFNTARGEVGKFKYMPYYMIGGFIIFSSSLVAIFLFVIAKRREIEAFNTQQSMPVAKEAVEEITPTIGKAAKEISKSVKKGLKDEE